MGVSSGADVPLGALIVAGFLLLELLNGAWLVFIQFSFPAIYNVAYIGSMYSSIHSLTAFYAAVCALSR